MQSIASALLLERAAAEGLNEIRSAGWPTSVKSLESLGEPLLRITGTDAGNSALFESDGVLFEVNLWGSHFQAVAAGINRQAVVDVFARLETIFPPPDPSSTHEVPVTFWMYSPAGAATVVAIDCRAGLGGNRVELRRVRHVSSWRD